MDKIKTRIFCDVTLSAIDPAGVLARIENTGHGAQNLFFGKVRAENRGREVVAVAYDAAVGLAYRALQEIAAEATQRWGREMNICVVHRIGKLAVGEVSVAIGVSATHRDEAYQASRYIIEQIKVRAPIWKKEYYSTGETDWLKGHSLCQHV